MKWTIVGQLGVIGMFALAILYSDGITGFHWLIQPEAVLLVGGGTLLLSLSELARPKEERLAAFLAAASAHAELMGALGTILGAILTLGTIDDVAALPRRLAVCFSSLFDGLLLSRVLLAPWARLAAAAAPPKPGGGLGRATGVAALMGLTAFFIPLWALVQINFPPSGVSLALAGDGSGLDELAPALKRFAEDYEIRLVARLDRGDPKKVHPASTALRNMRERLRKRGVPADSYIGGTRPGETASEPAWELRIVRPEGPIEAAEPVRLDDEKLMRVD